MTYLQMYFIVMLDKIIAFLVIAVAVFGVLGIVVPLFCLQEADTADKEEDKVSALKSAKKFFFRFIGPFILFLCLAVFTPTTKQACIIYAVPKIVNGLESSELPENLENYANTWLLDQIEDMSEEK